MNASAGASPVGAELGSITDEEFLALYDELAPVVFRQARHLGARDEALDDVVQEVFLALHRRRNEFQRRSSPSTFITGITLQVMRNHRRSNRRHTARISAAAAVVDIAHPPVATPHEEAELAQARAFLARFLDTLDDDRREVFVLMELEQMTAPQVAAMTNSNLNTVYGRLRNARRAFEEAAAEFRAGKEPGR